MTSQELTIELFDRVKKYKFIIIFSALFFAGILAIYALKTPVTYTSVSTIFPLTGSGDNNATTSALNALFNG